MTRQLDRLEHTIRHAVEADAQTGRYRCDRRIFTDEALFELEMKHIFEGNWVFLAHESQVENPGDYYTTYVGRQPVILTRTKDGELKAILNTCSHRGATLCRKKRGNRSSFTCPFHGWTFRNDGKLLKARDQKKGGYPDSFNVDGSHDLKLLPRFGNYRGFLFGSLNADVLPLEAYLGETTKIIDAIVDQAEHGLEVLRGTSTYTYDGNWKLTAENGADGYHVATVHWNYLSTMGQRNYEKGGTQAVDAKSWSNEGGFYSFENGHMMLWTRLTNPGSPAGVQPPGASGKEPGRGPRRLHRAHHQESLPVPECVFDGPVFHPDPGAPPAGRGQDGNHHLLLGAEGRARRRPGQAYSSVRGLLQRVRHGHARMTWKSSGGARRAITPLPCAGTT